MGLTSSKPLIALSHGLFMVVMVSPTFTSFAFFMPLIIYPTSPDANSFFGSKSGLEIDGLGRETVEVLLESKLIDNIEDIYSLKYEDLIDLPSWEKKKTNNLLNAIKSSTNASPEKLLTALGIRFIGKRTSQLLIQNFNSIDGVLNAKESDIESIHGISISVSKSLEDWKTNKENINLLNRLKNYGLVG